MKKIYLAGPDVFEPNSIKLGKKYVALCKEYGFEGLYPLDNEIDFSQSKHQTAKAIFQANKSMIEKADIVIANLNSFRGMEPDSGTVWECGYSSALNKEVYCYMKNTRPYVERFTSNQKTQKGNEYFDNNGTLIEDFNLPLNLMISCSAIEVVEGDLEDVLNIVKNLDAGNRIDE